MRRAIMSIAPTRTASVAAAVRGLSDGCPRIASPISVAHGIAIGVVVLTLSRRELPSPAYTAIGAKAANSPACTGNFP